jgi:hypothetical protein|tara:strand:+ start:5557 stop:5775 length:219 start_codon:yes stop_codon:yes gene_type:complete
MNDLINKPNHYTENKELETIEIIQNELSHDEYIGYLRGSIMKYLSRAGKKGDILPCLYKARWFLNKLIGLFE